MSRRISAVQVQYILWFSKYVSSNKNCCLEALLSDILYVVMWHLAKPIGVATSMVSIYVPDHLCENIFRLLLAEDFRKLDLFGNLQFVRHSLHHIFVQYALWVEHKYSTGSFFHLLFRPSKPFSNGDLARPFIFLSIFAKCKPSTGIADVTKFFSAVAFGAPGHDAMWMPCGVNGMVKKMWWGKFYPFGFPPIVPQGPKTCAVPGANQLLWGSSCPGGMHRWCGCYLATNPCRSPLAGSHLQSRWDLPGFSLGWNTRSRGRWLSHRSHSPTQSQAGQAP